MSELIVLNQESASIRYLSSKDKRLSKLITMIGDISYVPHNDGYAFLIHEVIEQMLSIKAGQKIYGRLVDLCNGEVNVSSVSCLSNLELRGIGTSSAKAACIQNITHKIAEGNLCLEDFHHLDDDEIIKSLTSIKGIGTWTAKMYLIFILNRQDVLPFEDGAFMQVYRWLYKTDKCSRQDVIKKCNKWKPYSSIAARYMYRALDMGFTRNEFHLFK